MPHSIEYDFDHNNELLLTICGAPLGSYAFAEGCAELEEDITEERGWFVASITLGSRTSKKISLNHRSGNWFEKAMFSELADKIEASSDAKKAWEEKVWRNAA